MPVVITDPKAGIACLLLALVGLGTWPALMDICTLYKRNSLHIFLDYASGDFLFAAVAAVTLGTLGPETPDNPSFFHQVADIKNNWPSVLSTLGGGAILMFGNLTLQIALTMGVSLGVILPIQGALCVVVSSSINYLLSPEFNDGPILFIGVGFFLLAILISTHAEISYKRYLKEHNMDHPDGIMTKRAKRKLAASEAQKDSTSEASTAVSEDGLADEDSDGLPEFGEVATERAAKNTNQATCGILVAVSGGLAFGFFSPLFNIGVNDQFNWLPEGTVHLTGWTANFYFGLSFWFWAHVINLVRMKRSSSEKTDCNSYIKDNNKRLLAIATGLLCGVGNTLQFLGGMAAGFATCDMVQAFPLVGIIWGMTLFGEFRKAKTSVKVELVVIYIVYILAVGFLALSVKAE